MLTPIDEEYESQDAIAAVEWSFRDYLLLGSLYGIFLGFCRMWFHFTLDDAFITLRYSKHLASGAGLVWNVGGDPVEGYTSALWMLIGTVPHLFDLPPILFMKLTGVVSVLLCVTGIYWSGRLLGASRSLLVAVCSVIVANPGIALNTVQGMETPLAMLLVLGTGLAGVAYMRSPNRRRLASLYVLSVLSVLTRPGLVVAVATFLVFSLAVTYHRYGGAEARRLSLYGILGLLIPGIVYMVVRVQYFGYPLPTPFYVKSNASGLNAEAQDLTEQFLSLILPLLFLSFLSGVSVGREKYRRMMTALPLFVSATVFLFIWLFFDPVQAFLWRYQLPALPLVLLGIVLVVRDFDGILFDLPIGIDRRLARGVVVAIVITALFLSPIQYTSDVQDNVDRRSSDSRVQIGQALGEVERPSKHTMVTTESGAVPYYSEWHAIDVLGLNNESIAHGGFDREILENSDPDLFLFGSGREENVVRNRNRVLFEYISDHRYELAAAIAKSPTEPASAGGKNYYYVLVAPDSPVYRTVVCRLRTLNRVEHLERSVWSDRVHSSIAVTDIRPEDC